MQEQPMQEGETERNLPSELKHRPKIPRTPHGNNRQNPQQDIPQDINNVSHNQDSGEKGLNNNDSSSNILPLVTKNGKQISVISFCNF